MDRNAQLFARDIKGAVIGKGDRVAYSTARRGLRVGTVEKVGNSAHGDMVYILADGDRKPGWIHSVNAIKIQGA